MIRNRQPWFGARSQSSRSGAAASRRRQHWVLEGLEDRLLLSSSPTTYTVDLTSDSGASTSALAGDILYCVTQANANTNTAGSVIEFNMSTPQTITLSSTLDLSETAGPETIENLGASVTISGNNAVQVFLVDSGVTATLSGLTISGGMTTQSGGGISNAGTLSVTDCTISHNSTSTGSGGGGGGVYNAGTLTIIGSTVSGNTANPQDYNAGGGIYDAGTLTVNGCTISGNSANSGGGAFFVNSDHAATISDTTFSDNSAILVPNAQGNYGGTGGGVFDFGATGLTVTDSIFTGNTAGAGGGGIDVYECPLTITDTTLSSNTAGAGGGIDNYSSPVTVADCTLSSNTTSGNGGAFYDDGGTDTFTNSTIAGNSAAEGGGIFDVGVALTAVNCTIAYNEGASAGDGGGIGVGTGTVTLDNTIVALNTDGTGSGAPADDITSYAYYGSVQLAAASANNLIGTGGADGLTNGTNNNQVGVNPGFDPNGLQWNGGPTQTIALAGGSLAINKGSPALAVDASGNRLTTDQRGAGFARTVNNKVDIGAFQTGNATGYLVNLTSDTGEGSDGAGDLLYCITQANANTNTAGSLIEFAPTVFNSANPQTITLSSTLNLNETAGPELLVGPGASVVTISGNNAVGVFNVLGDVTATLSGLTVSGGMNNQSGGGIYNGGTLTITNCTFTNNTSGSEGGAIANPGTLTLTNSTISDNTAPFGGGIDNEGILTVNGSTLESNMANNAGGYGGGIYNYDAMATLNNATVEMNSAVADGGGIFNTSSSTLTVTDCTFSGNSGESGGAIANSGGDPESKLTLTDSIIVGNSSTGTASDDGGGGIDNSSASASITGCTLSSNSAYGSGGGILTTAAAMMTILDSTISDNSVSSSDSFGTGGGIEEDSGGLTVTNSTIAGNSAQYVGAGIHASSGTMTAVNCTIAYNNEPSQSSGLGGGIDITEGTATLDNTIIALNTDGTGTSAPADNIFIDGGGTVSSASANNLLATGGNSGLTNNVNGNLVGVSNPDLGSLANNGGPTQTIALLSGTPGSPAINAGNVSLAVDADGNPLTTDQRGAGFPRFEGPPNNETVDIGAFEGTVAPTNPTVYTVDLTSDSGASTGPLAGDILYCVTQANANTNTAGSEIEFSPTVSTITLTGTLDLSETAGPETIENLGANVVTISGNNSVAVFDVPEGMTVTLSNVTISNGSAASGGGIDNSGTLTVSNCTLTGNSATGYEGGGGGIFNSGTLTVTGSTLSDNTASSQADALGGGIDNSGALTVSGSTISGNSAFAGGGIENDGIATITGGSIANNTASVFGGGIDNSGTLTVNTATIQGNSVGVNGSGGGIDNSGSLTVAGSTIANNSASQSGGSVASGGGIYSDGSLATILDTTLSGNSAPSGGGVYVASGVVTVANSTLSGNSAVRDGGGIYIQTGTLTAVNCTIAYNSLDGGGGGGGLDVSGGTATLDNTIVATNTAGTGAGATANDIAGTVSSSSAFNMIGTGGSGGLTTGAPNDNLVGVANPDLGTLANNGGPTQTIALLTGSPAINAGSIGLAFVGGQSLTTDQRGTGFARTVNGTIDIGAFEIQTVTNNPVPALSAILPNLIGVGYASPITLTVTGSGFISQSVVDWTSTALATTYVSSSELTATIPASDFAATGSFPITVVNPTPGGGTSTAVTFRVLAAPSTVFVNTTYAGDPLGTVVTIDGSTHTVGYDAFGTIQAGVTAVASGGTVDIAAGTYVEQVTITHSLTLAGAGSSDTTIQAPADFFASDDEVTIASGASVAMSGFFVEKPGGDSGLNSGTGIADVGGTLTATDLLVFGFTTGVAVENDGAATITDSTIFDNDFGIVVDSSSSGTSSVTANNDSLAGDNVGVLNLQTSGTIDARFDYWGSASGPTTSANPGGTGAASSANVDFNPWLGDANLAPYDYLVFSTTGDNDIVSPISGNTQLNITSGNSAGVDPPFGLSLAILPGGDTLGFTGSGSVTIRGESGNGDVFSVKDTSVQFQAADGLQGTTITFNGTAITRNVDAEGGNNVFNIMGAGGRGPSGDLVGDSSTNQFFFYTGELQGSIEGGGRSTLNYRFYSTAVDVNLGNGTNGTATGVSGSVSGVTAVIGSSNNYQAVLNAGSVPDVTLTGGLGSNVLFGNGAGDSVLESIGSSYTLTNGVLTGTGASFGDALFGIKIVTLYGTSFNVSGWTGTGSLIATGSAATVTASKNANFDLSNSSLQTSDGMSLSLSGIRVANLSGTGHDNVFGISYWTGTGSLADTAGLIGVTVLNSSVTLTNSSVTAGPMALALSGFITADLTELSDTNPSPGSYNYNVSGWTHQGFLEGFNIVSVTASESSNITLTNSLLTSGTMSMDLSRIAAANLTVTAATGNPSLTINASAFSGPTNLTAAGTVKAILYGGAGSHGSLTAAGSGNNILIGNAGNTTLTDTGSGHNILIGGGAGGDSFVGNGNDILVSGTTEYDSVTSAHIAALDAILAVWDSGSSYASRVSRIRLGFGVGRSDAFNAHTIHTDSNPSTLTDRHTLLLPGRHSYDWFVVSRRDAVTRRQNETKTFI